MYRSWAVACSDAFHSERQSPGLKTNQTREQHEGPACWSSFDDPLIGFDGRYFIYPVNKVKQRNPPDVNFHYILFKNC